MSEEKPNFPRRNPDAKIPGQSDPVSAEELGARVVPDSEGTVFSKPPEEETKIIQPNPPANPVKPPAGTTKPPPVSGTEQKKGAGDSSEKPPAFSNLKPPPTSNPMSSGPTPSGVPSTGVPPFPEEPRPIAFTPRVDQTPTTFADEEDEDKGGSAALLIAIAALLLSVLGILIAAGLVPFGPSSEMIGQDRLADNSVGEVQIQDEAVTLGKINPDIVDKLRGERGPRGEAGERGPAGPAGPGLGAVQLRTKEVSGTSTSSRASALVTCNAGEVLLSGGASVSGADGKVAIVASNPSQESNAWFAESARIDPENQDSWTLTVYARCGKKVESSSRGNGDQ